MATYKSFFGKLGGRLHSMIRAVTVGINGILFFATVFSAYGGCFDPVSVPVAALAAMILPAILIAGIALMVIDCFVSYRIASMIIISWLISLPEILIFFPLNITGKKLTPQEEARSFTLLTYNCLHFAPYVPSEAGESNGTAAYILHT
ncbi:MAG: hypothetical protein K2H98_06680, partial [Duncaniella sp.]|nr:hypothetical protein [Duncaniella sp.]